MSDETLTSAFKVMQNTIEGEKRVISLAGEGKSTLKGKISPIYGRLSKGHYVFTAFSQYELIEQVGEGGNGRVFSAKNSDGENFAIKFIESDKSSEKRKRFKNEINFCEQHKHKNIVSIVDRGQAFLEGKNYSFYVMPLYDETLRKKMKTGIPHHEILNIFVGLLEGLMFAHKHGSIHRDIKPENIMFSKDSFDPIICDFGIAHFAEEELFTAVETKATDRMANFYYAAPEQYNRTGKVYPQTDIYSVALILNEMFTGEIPQAAGYKRIDSVNPEYKYLDNIFESLFKQNPEERLFPEELILSELKVLIERHKRNDEKEKLKAVIEEVIEPEDFCPKIINLEYKNNCIYFTFDSIFPVAWCEFLIHESFSHSWLMGYEKDRLKRIDSKTIAMPTRGNPRDDTLKSVVNNVKEWVVIASREYLQQEKRKAIAEQKRKEAERAAQIQKIETEDEMNLKLNSILKEIL